VRILALLNSAFDASFAIAICIMVRNNMLFNVAFKERLQYLGGCTLYATLGTDKFHWLYHTETVVYVRCNEIRLHIWN
jgi:hypothetical protein